MTNRQIKQREAAEYAYNLYLQALEKGMTNQQAIDVARSHKKVLVSDRTMRNYIKLMEGNE